VELRRHQRIHLGETTPGMRAPAAISAAGRGPIWTAGMVPAVAAAIYVFVFVRHSSLLFGDFPNHLARAKVMADLLLHGGKVFSAVFQCHLMMVPYVLGDVALMLAVNQVGTGGATLLWTLLALLSLPLAMLFYLRRLNVAAGTRAFVFLLGLYLASDWFYFAGFVSFRFSVALILVALALVRQLRSRWSAGLFIGYALVVICGYLTHLAFIAFLAAALCASAVQQLCDRKSAVSRELAIAAPVLVTLLWHWALPAIYGVQPASAGAHYFWAGLQGKVRALDWAFVRFNEPLDLLLMALFALCLLWPVRRWWRVRPFDEPAVRQALVIVAAWIAMYVMFPAHIGDAGYLDVRALAFVAPFIVVTIVSSQGPAAVAGARQPRFSVPCAVLVVAANVLVLAPGVAADEQWLSGYRSAVASLPRGARVLPVYTWRQQGRWLKYRHVDSFVTLDRDGFIPTLFSGDHGQPMTYFRYLGQPYEPPADWYPAGQDTLVNWQAVACEYEFILAMKPFAEARIGPGIRPVMSNDVVSLLAIDKHGCAPGAVATTRG
jgi:hypothetical protein